MIRAKAVIEDGGMRVVNRSAFDDAVGALPDGRYVLTLEDEKEARSSRANRFYWGAVVKAFCEKIEGYTPDEMHELLKFKCNRRTMHDPQTGEIVEVGMPTHTMSQAEFTMYVDSCTRWASELGIEIQTLEEI